MAVWTLLAVLAVAPAPSAGTETARAAEAVVATIDAMEAAVARADSGAYMLLVDTTDPVFAEEQRKWARDLRTRPVERVGFIAETPPRFEGGSWTVPLTVTWRLPGEDADRSVSYDAAFRPLGLAEGAWVYTGRVWEETATDTVRVLAVPGDAVGRGIAGYLNDRMAELLAGVEGELNRALPTAPTVKIYPDMASMQASIALSYTDPLGGWNEPGESIKILGRPGLAGPRLDPLIAHELGHAVSFEYGPGIINAPWWALEGIAEIAADLFRDHRPSARMLAENGRLIDFARLADFRGEAMNHGLQVYIQGHSMLAYIADRFGRQARHDWLAAMGTGQSLDEATHAVFNLSFDQLDQDWRMTLVKDAALP